MRLLVILTLVLSGCQGYTCITDADCSDGYACRPDLEEGRIDSITGCVSRCSSDDECSAGNVCLSDGTCG